MSDLIVFGFENQQVRFVGTPDKPEWVAEWVAQDVETVLEQFFLLSGARAVTPSTRTNSLQRL